MKWVASTFHTTSEHGVSSITTITRLRLKYDGTCAETRFLLSARRTSPFKPAGRQFSRLLAADVCASALVMLDTPCSEVVRRVLATHSNRQFPLHFPSRASQCAIAFQMDSTFRMCNPRFLTHRMYGMLVPWFPIDPPHHSVV